MTMHRSKLTEGSPIATKDTAQKSEVLPTTSARLIQPPLPLNLKGVIRARYFLTKPFGPLFHIVFEALLIVNTTPEELSEFIYSKPQSVREIPVNPYPGFPLRHILTPILAIETKINKRHRRSPVLA
jgi:hypothetical protein